MIEVGKTYEVSYLFDIFYQLETGQYPPQGFETFDKVYVYKIENSMAYCKSEINKNKVMPIPVQYLYEEKQ